MDTLPISRSSNIALGPERDAEDYFLKGDLENAAKSYALCWGVHRIQGNNELMGRFDMEILYCDVSLKDLGNFHNYGLVMIDLYTAITKMLEDN